jgi:hypothetical protein
MAFIGENLAAGASLNQGYRVFLGGRPVKFGSKGLADQGPSCGVMAAHAGVNLCKELASFLLGYTPLEDAGDAPFVQLAFMDPIGL